MNAGAQAHTSYYRGANGNFNRNNSAFFNERGAFGNQYTGNAAFNNYGNYGRGGYGGYMGYGGYGLGYGGLGYGGYGFLPFLGGLGLGYGLGMMGGYGGYGGYGGGGYGGYGGYGNGYATTNNGQTVADNTTQPARRSDQSADEPGDRLRDARRIGFSPANTTRRSGLFAMPWSTSRTMPG